MRITRVSYVTNMEREVKYVEDFCWKFRWEESTEDTQTQRRKRLTKEGGFMPLWTRHTGGRRKPGDGYCCNYRVTY